MFSKIRKHLNIMCLLLILLIGILGIVLVGVYSIDDYCEEYIIAKLQAEDKLIDNDIACMMGNAESILYTVEVCLNSNSNIIEILDNIKSTNLIKNNRNVSDVYVINNNLLYSMKDSKRRNAKEAQDTEWYKKTIDNEELYVSNCFEDFNTGEKCIAICKSTRYKEAVIAVCIRISNLINALRFEEVEDAYIINQNNVIVANMTDAYTNINVVDEHKQLPKGHDDIFKDINIIDGVEEISTSGGRLLVSCLKSSTRIKCVIIRDKIILNQEINNKYLEVLTMLVAAFLLIIGLCIVAGIYSRKIKNVNYSKCEFIEGMAAEIKIPLDSINYLGKTVRKDVEDENIIQGVNAILENAQSIAFVLNSAYDYSKIAINDFKIINNKYSINNVIRNVERVVRCDVQKNNVYFDSYIDGNENLLLFGDQRKVEEIIINLVKISAQHTIQGGIELKVMYADLAVDRVNIMLIVKDSGIGMTDNELSDYAEELNNVSLSLEVGDTGSGINMVKQLVRILNGKIVVDSTKNVGTIYTVMVPQKIYTTEDSKWENENVKSSIELMNEFSYIKDKDKIAQYTTQIERRETTIVERREIKKNDVDCNIEQSSVSLDNFEDNNTHILDELLAGSGIELDESVDGMVYQQNNVEYIPESFDNEVSQEQYIKEEAENGYDIPMPDNQAEFLLKQNHNSYENCDTTQNEYNNNQQNERQEFEVENEEQEVQEEFEVENEEQEVQEEFEVENEEQEEQEEFEVENEEQEEQEEFEVENEEQEEQEEFEIESEENIGKSEEEELEKKIACINSYLSQFGVEGARILEVYGNDIEEYKKSLVRFYDYSKEGANRIISLWNNKNIKDYFSSLDAVNEGAREIGATKLSEIIIKQLEKGEQGDLKYVAQTVNDVFSEWKMLLNAIIQFLQNYR